MATVKTPHGLGSFAMPVAQGSEVIQVTMVYQMVAALAASDVLVLGYLPADHVPVDYIIDPDDLDSATTITFDLGLGAAFTDVAISTAAAEGGAKWLTASAIFQTGTWTRNATNVVNRVTPVAAVNRPILIVVVAGPSTSTNGKIRFHLSYRAAAYGA